MRFTRKSNCSVFRSHVDFQVVMVNFFTIMNSGAERFNGLMAMLGVIAAVGAYATTGQMIPGIFWC